MRCKLSPQSHFTCLFHDHACSCIGGPHRLVQSHFTCHSHEWSSSLFFVHVYPTHTCSRVSCLFHVSSSSVSCCSSVSVSTDVIRQNVFLTYKAISRLRALVDFTADRTTDLSEFFQHTRNSRLSCRHISSSCCLPFLGGTRTHAALLAKNAALPARYYGLRL